MFQTKRYYRCPVCGAVYIEVLEPEGSKIIDIEKHSPKKKECATLDKWMVET